MVKKICPDNVVFVRQPTKSTMKTFVWAKTRKKSFYLILMISNFGTLEVP